MEEDALFLSAVSAVYNGTYSPNDIKKIKQQLMVFEKKEVALKREMEKEKNNYVKAKEKASSELKQLRKNVKEIRLILKNI